MSVPDEFIDQLNEIFKKKTEEKKGDELSAFLMILMATLGAIEYHSWLKKDVANLIKAELVKADVIETKAGIHNMLVFNEEKK